MEYKIQNDKRKNLTFQNSKILSNPSLILLNYLKLQKNNAFDDKTKVNIVISKTAQRDKLDAKIYYQRS